MLVVSLEVDRTIGSTAVRRAMRGGCEAGNALELVARNVAGVRFASINDVENEELVMTSGWSGSTKGVCSYIPCRRVGLYRRYG